MQETLLLGVALALVTAAVYVIVGNRVNARSLGGDDRLANSMFAAWWWLLGAITVSGATVNLAAAVGYTSLPVHLALTVVLVFALCASLWALGFYLVYLFTGRRGAIYPLGLFYLGYYTFIVYLIRQAHPVGVEVGRWSASIEYEQALLAGNTSIVLLLLLVAPQIVGGVAYLSLFFQVDDRSQKYRIGMIAGSILVWFGSSVVAGVVGLTGTDAWAVASRLIALAAAGIVYIAFQPPGWMQRRYRVDPVAMITTPTGPAPGMQGGRFSPRLRTPRAAATV